MSDKKEKWSQKDIDEAFAAFDKDGNGTISAKELKDAMKALDPSRCPTDKEIKALLEGIDTDSDGKLSRAEFTTLMNKLPDEGEMRKAFDSFDTDHSGFVTKKELKKAMCNCGVKLTDEELDKMIKAADKDGDSKINFEEFKEMMCKCA